MDRYVIDINIVSIDMNIFIDMNIGATNFI